MTQKMNYSSYHLEKKQCTHQPGYKGQSGAHRHHVKNVMGLGPETSLETLARGILVRTAFIGEYVVASCRKLFSVTLGKYLQT